MAESIGRVVAVFTPEQFALECEKEAAKKWGSCVLREGVSEEQTLVWFRAAVREALDPGNAKTEHGGPR